MPTAKPSEATRHRAQRPDQSRDASPVEPRSKRRVNAEQERQTKAYHTRLLVLFGWILYGPSISREGHLADADNTPSSLHALGIFYFTKGFLLTRLVLDYKSECLVSPIEGERSTAGSRESGCWHPKTFDKAVVVLVDALRYDFTVPLLPATEQAEPRPHYRNALNVLHRTASERPENALLLPFIADPPTTTLQRLKGLTTGTLPTFVDAGSNFAGTAIDEDNLVAQLRDAGKVVVHLGDDTWQSLFPGYLDPELSKPYDSFNVWDLHTVDDGVTTHLLPLLAPSNTSSWDVIFAHYLGVDHAGHRYGPDHPAMGAKLRQMDTVIEQLMMSLDESTLLVLMGDHGMDAKGDHGGESDDEVQAALWMYSKNAVFGRASPEDVAPPSNAKERPVWQIDLVPTLALILGLPIPFNNLGAPIKEAFLGRGSDWRNVARVTGLAAAQVKRYQQEYALARGLSESTFLEPLALWKLAQQRYSLADGSGLAAGDATWQRAHEALAAYQAETLRICKGLWARFDVPSMSFGIVILLVGVVLLVAYVRASTAETSRLLSALPRQLIRGAAVALATGGVSALLVPLGAYALAGVTLGAAVASVAIGIYAVTQLGATSIPRTRLSLWTCLALLFTASQSIGFASNSYTIWEDEILLFFLASFGLLSAVASMRRTKVGGERGEEPAVSNSIVSIVFVVLTRVASLSRLCREEQMPYCRSTFYASENSSTSAPWQLGIPYGLCVLMPAVILYYYPRSDFYLPSSPSWTGYALPAGQLVTAIFWTLDTADDGDWFSLDEDVMKSIKVILARLVLGISAAAVTATFWAPAPRPQIDLSRLTLQADGVLTTRMPGFESPKTIIGYANTHGTRYFQLLCSYALALVLLLKPMGQLSFGVLTWQILCLLEIVEKNSLQGSPIGPVMLGLLGNYHFFKTGHQATLSSIQWESAFIPLKQVQYIPGALLVTGNTFAAQILCTVAVPLVVLWKVPPPRNKNHSPLLLLLAHVGRAVATYLAYHAFVNLSTTVWAAWLRRHLMLYRIFSPRWMVGSAVLLVCDVVGILVTLVGVRWSTLSVARIFGWA